MRSQGRERKFSSASFLVSCSVPCYSPWALASELLPSCSPASSENSWPPLQFSLWTQARDFWCPWQQHCFGSQTESQAGLSEMTADYQASCLVIWPRWTTCSHPGTQTAAPTPWKPRGPRQGGNSRHLLETPLFMRFCHHRVSPILHGCPLRKHGHHVQSEEGGWGLSCITLVQGSLYTDWTTWGVRSDGSICPFPLLPREVPSPSLLDRATHDGHPGGM